MLLALWSGSSYEDSSMKVRYSALSDPGLKRDVNQDSYGISTPEQDGHRGHLLVVCDGMGGHAAGEVASRLGVEAILHQFKHSTENNPAVLLEQAFGVANQQIYMQGRGTMGTTGVAAFLVDHMLYVANVGDSRAYLIRAGQIQQISQDHSFVAEQVMAGLLTAAEARSSVHRNMITRALGHQHEVQVDLFSLPLQAGDMVLLSTDGLHGVVEEYDIVQVALTLPPDAAVQRLVELANAGGGPDNITVILAAIDGLESSDTPDPSTAVTEPLRPIMMVDVPAHSITDRLSPTTTEMPKELPLSRWGLVLALLTLLVLIVVGVAVLWLPVDEAATAMSMLFWGRGVGCRYRC